MQAEYKTLVSRASQLRDRVLEGLDDVAENIEQEITAADTNKPQKTLETLTQFQQRVLNDGTTAATRRLWPWRKRREREQETPVS